MTEIANLFKTISVGVYVIGVAAEDSYNAFTAAWVMQVSFNPMLLALSINPKHASYSLLNIGCAFSVNVLANDQIALANHFGQSKSADKLAGVAWHRGHCGVPLLEDVAAQFECTVQSECTAGDHQVVIGRVIGGRLIRPGVGLLLYGETGNLDSAADLFPKGFGSRDIV